MRSFLLLIGSALLFICNPANADEPKNGQGEAEEEIQRLQATQKNLLNQLRRELAISQSSPSAAGSHQTEQQKEREKRMYELLAEIEKRINSEGGVRTRYASTMTNEPAIQKYITEVKRRLETEGERNFPKTDGKSLYGQVAILLTLSADGKAESIEVLKSSSRQLADHSVTLLYQLTPFERFSEDLASQTDLLVIPLRFGYSKGAQ